MAIWVSTAFFAVMLVVGQLLESRVREHRQQLFRIEQQRIFDEDHEAYRYVVQWFNEHRDKTGEGRLTWPSREDAMALLAKSESSGTRSATTSSTSRSREQRIFTDPQTGAQVRLYLLGERWQISAPITRTVAPPSMPTAISTLRHGLVVAIFVIWIGLMVFRPSLRLQRQVWGNGLLAVVVIAIVATALQERQPPPGSWRLEQASILFCLVALILSISFLMAAYAKVKADHPVCGWCGYNLTGNRSGVCPECGAPTMATEGDAA
jgi:hypothetical protein